MKEDEIVELNMPSSSGEGGVSVIDSAINDIQLNDGEDDEASGVYVSKDQLSEKMVTLSLVPKTRWQTLLHLDLIRVCNEFNLLSVPILYLPFPQLTHLDSLATK